MNPHLSREEVDTLINEFRHSPDENTFLRINNWYDKAGITFHDQEFVMLVYLFIAGANIQHNYFPMDKQQRNATIKQANDLMTGGEPNVRLQRITYFKYGSKAGYYR